MTELGTFLVVTDVKRANGAALTVAWSMLTGVQALSLPVVLCVAGIIVAVVGLKLTTPHDEPAGQPDVTASAT